MDPFCVTPQRLDCCGMSISSRLSAKFLLRSEASFSSLFPNKSNMKQHRVHCRKTRARESFRQVELFLLFSKTTYNKFTPPEQTRTWKSTYSTQHPPSQPTNTTKVSIYKINREPKHQRDGALRIVFAGAQPASSIGSVCMAMAAAAAIAADGNADSDRCRVCDLGDLMVESLPSPAAPAGGPPRSIELPFSLVLDPLNPPSFRPSPVSCRRGGRRFWSIPEPPRAEFAGGESIGAESTRCISACAGGVATTAATAALTDETPISLEQSTPVPLLWALLLLLLSTIIASNGGDEDPLPDDVVVPVDVETAGARPCERKRNTPPQADELS